VALILLTGWTMLLTITGKYGQLLDYATFGDWLACAFGVATVFWYRRHDDGHAPLDFRVPGYPWPPILFIATVGFVMVQSLISSPVNTGIGLLIILAGIPVYYVWRRLFSPAEP
jgi:APA family basic amino acid/polyamine antiporter